MKCFKHSTDAVAVCVYCGRATCKDCIISLTAPQVVCSHECAAALANDAKAVQLLLYKSTQSTKASAFYCYLTSALSGAAAITAWFMLPSPFLILFTGGCAAVLLASGVWYSLASRKQS